MIDRIIWAGIIVYALVFCFLVLKKIMRSENSSSKIEHEPFRMGEIERNTDYY
jgi:hypothetical protein